MGEQETLDRLLKGEKSAWDRFVARHAGVIFAAVRRRLEPAGRLDDAEDVAQDVFLKLCARDFALLRRFDPAKSKLTTWLTVIATSTTIDHLRRQKAPAVALDSVNESQLAVDPLVRTRISIPPEVLTERQSLILEMLYQRDMDVAEVAELLEVNPQTVRSTHHKALLRLREHFAERETG